MIYDAERSRVNTSLLLVSFACIVFIALGQVVPEKYIGPHIRTVWDADPPEVRPAYWMCCPEPTCENTNPMGPRHWRYWQGDTNHLTIEYVCTNCSLLFWIHKPTH